MNERKEAYKKQRDELNAKCVDCRKLQTPSYERCNYGCSIGKKLRWLETEYSDVTGFSHKNWGKGM